MVAQVKALSLIRHEYPGSFQRTSKELVLRCVKAGLGPGNSRDKPLVAVLRGAVRILTFQRKAIEESERRFSPETFHFDMKDLS